MSASIIDWLIPVSLSARLITLRKDRSLSQQALADAISIHVNQIKRYEAGTAQPSLDVIKKLAKTFSVSTDWLLFDEAERDPADDLRLQFEAVSQFDDEEKNVIRALMDGMIIKHQAKRLLRAPATPAKSTAKTKTGSRERARA